MKSTRALRWVTVVSLATLAACGGVSHIGSGDDAGLGKSGSGMVGAGTGGREPEGTGAMTMGGSSSMGAVTGAEPGTGATAGALCKADANCVVPGSNRCQECADGSVACGKVICDAGQCAEIGDSCPVTCATDGDCPAPDVCTMCSDGSQACPVTQCLQGSCETSLSRCPETDPCRGQPCGQPCKICDAAGVCNTALLTYCGADGACKPGLPQCADPGKCMTAKDCGTPPPNCVPCGNDTCAGFECIDSACVFTCPANPDPQCMVTSDCPDIGDVCKMCPQGGCAFQACVQGSCELVCTL